MQEKIIIEDVSGFWSRPKSKPNPSPVPATNPHLVPATNPLSILPQHMDDIEALLGAYEAVSAATIVPDSDSQKAAMRELIQEGKRTGLSSLSSLPDEPMNIAEIWGVPVPRNQSELREASSILKAGECECRITKFPFAMGGVRVAYHAQIRTSTSSWSNVVLKQFILESDRQEVVYIHQAENSAVGFYICEEYKKIHPSSKPLVMVLSRILKVRRKIGTREEVVLYHMEDYLSGAFKKWTNNVGGIVERQDDIIRLALWSYDFSGGYVLLSDLQGVETSEEIRLTDPAILCRDLSRFGPTNFHESQMRLCLQALIGKHPPVLDSIVSSIRPSHSTEIITSLYRSIAPSKPLRR